MVCSFVSNDIKLIEFVLTIYINWILSSDKTISEKYVCIINKIGLNS